MTHRRLSFLSLHFGLVLACTTVLSAKLNRGTIEGTVTDPQGATLSGVDVSITSVDTNVVTTTTTNSAGYYRGEALVPGTYRANFAAKGFAMLDMTAISVAAAQVIRVDARLKVGSFNEKVTVKAELPMLQTDASNFSSTLQPDIIQNRPLAGRDLQQLSNSGGKCSMLSTIRIWVFPTRHFACLPTRLARLTWFIKPDAPSARLRASRPIRGI
jgi:hypothetical protein